MLNAEMAINVLYYVADTGISTQADDELEGEADDEVAIQIQKEIAQEEKKELEKKSPKKKKKKKKSVCFLCFWRLVRLFNIHMYLLWVWTTQIKVSTQLQSQ